MIADRAYQKFDEAGTVDEFRLQVTSQPRNDVDLEGAQRAIFAFDGNIAVESDYEPDSVGSIAIPENVGLTLTPDTGTVIAAGLDILEVHPGDRVLVMPVDGFWVMLDTPNYKSKSLVRMYGFYGEPWYDSVVAVIEDTLRPLGRQVLIKRDAPVKESRGILLPDELHARKGTAVIEQCGQLCSPDVKARVGKRVIYSLEHVKRVDAPDGKFADYGIISEEFIFGTIE